MRKILMHNKEKRPKDTIRNIIIGIILIPIIEKILSPIYDFFADKFLSISHAWIHFISRLVYTRIAKGVYINISFYIFVVIISVLLCLLLLSILLPYKKANSCCNAEHIKVCEKRKNLSFWEKARCFIFNPSKRTKTTLLVSVVLYIFFMFFILSTNFINNTITRITNNIEIVSPYITDYEYKMLKSKFYSMESRDDYDEICGLMEQYASDAGVDMK